MVRDIYAALTELAEDGIRKFNERIVATNYPVMGVRMPAIKRLAAEIATLPNVDLARYLTEGLTVEAGHDGKKEDLTFEQVQLYGLVLAAAAKRRRITSEEVFERFEALVPRFDSWAHVDTVVADLKIFERHRDEVFERFRPLKNHPHEYSKRTFVVILMDYFMDSTNIERTLKELQSVPQGQYYVDMAIAWAMSVALIKHWDLAIPLFEKQVFTRFVHNKAIQKARESYRVDPELKRHLNTLKVR